ncbi:MAG: hypothetical protein AUJ18_07625 [Candidatus Hydrogenedentes bacterium CG1_02_42_14]|nr:MAG: hypothetical protein AUJ18_07625 [Candidatus Hydrogenedentes bacterium CG1_02_42_14]
MKTDLRINAFAAHSLGIARRKADELIKAGRIMINGRQALLNDRVTSKDDVFFEEKKISLPEHIYIAMNKPAGCLTAVSDSRDKTVMELLPKKYKGIFPVGRLDRDSKGLLLFTNNGEWADRILHPRYAVPRNYIVKTDKPVDLNRIKFGVRLRDGISRFDTVEIISRDAMTVEISLHKGKKRQIRRTFEKVGYQVIELVRIGFGSIQLGDMKEGSVRELTPMEVDSVWRRKPSVQTED